MAGLQEASGKAGVPAAEFEAFLQFASVFFGNMGNYLSFGMFLRFVSETDWGSTFVPENFVSVLLFIVLCHTETLCVFPPPSFSVTLMWCVFCMFPRSMPQQNVHGESPCSVDVLKTCTMRECLHLVFGMIQGNLAHEKQRPPRNLQ